MATVTANKKDLLVNPALWELGDDGLSSLSTTATSPKEKMCANTIDGIVNEVLFAGDWLCVSKRDSSLTQSSSHTPDEFLYAYDLPSDFVRLIGPPAYYGYFGILVTPDGKRGWRVVGRKLETDYFSPDILYVYKTSFDDEDNDTDTYYTLFDENLKRSIQCLCMARWSYAVSGRDQSRYEALYRQVLREARARNRLNNPPQQVGTGRITAKRLRGV